MIATRRRATDLISAVRGDCHSTIWNQRRSLQASVQITMASFYVVLLLKYNLDSLAVLQTVNFAIQEEPSIGNRDASLRARRRNRQRVDQDYLKWRILLLRNVPVRSKARDLGFKPVSHVTRRRTPTRSRQSETAFHMRKA